MIPQAQKGLDRLKVQVMREQGFAVNPERPDAVKYEVARAVGIPLNPDYNGHLSTKQAGKIGGRIGGPMVREMVRIAQQALAKR